jgi:hypothetical protein
MKLIAMLELLKIFWAWVPPPPTLPPEANWYFIRIAIASFCGAWGVVILLALLFGVFPKFSGFATEDEVRYDRIHTLDNQLFNLNIHYCNASNTEIKIEFLRRLQVLKTEYYSLVHVEYSLPSCKDLSKDISE